MVHGFKEFSILTPTPMLGYGYPLSHFWHGIHHYKPSAIIIDSGSTDPGPYLIGTGLKLCSKASYIRDLTPVLEACSRYGIKVLISSAGGDGSNAHVDELVDFIREIAESKGFWFKVATIYSAIDASLVRQKFKNGAVHPCSSAPELMLSDIDESKMILAQMGAEPYVEVLKDPAVDIIVSGRSYDPAPFAGWCIHNGVEPNAAWHMGKIMECGALCALPKGSAMIATMSQDSFVLTPLNPIERCSPLSVAAHTLYEKTRPDRLPGPGGILNLEEATYEQLDDGRSVRVRGSVFVPSEMYQVKLEGVTMIGYRTVFIGGIRDPILIAGIDAFIETVRAKVANQFALDDSIVLNFHIYGRDAVMGSLEPTPRATHEIGILGEVLAPTQEMASAVAGFARTMCLHCSYEGQIATAGNFASPLTPLEQPAGEVYKFSIYHLMDIGIEAASSLFPKKVAEIGTQTNGHINRANGFNGAIAYPELEVAEPAPVGTTASQAKLIEVKKAIQSGPTPMQSLAKIIRSKNSGPFELTLDILFDDREVYDRVVKADVLNRDTIKRLYRLKEEDIVVLMYFEPALAWKCTFKRPWSQGSVGERDTFGSQQHAPLLDIIVPA
jgi:Domain of unknown function (DUF4387)/Acyclic terpene utilisation family protein AtuA